ncbi:hypothetical protein V492_03736 [Pseudogymnoascus sp. VKM F-4246]|nr:hypothetical protein V492_03736 [Pseudogymnoascus sp. VKM F-4246]
MRGLYIGQALAAVLSLSWGVQASDNFTYIDMMRARNALMDTRDDCPPCFNCLLPAFTCGQYAECQQYDGKCSCPAGFGGDDCLQPVCGSLADGKERPMRKGDKCDCKDGWGGINCNVCTTNQACNALMPENTGGVCYQNGEVVKQNYQMCDVTNKKIRDLLNEKFGSNRGNHSTALSAAALRAPITPTSATAQTIIAKISSAPVFPTGCCPATFECLQQDGGTNKCAFQEPKMNDLIQQMFGDKSITLECRSGECLYETEVPGYERPIKKINTPLIAGVIAASSLFVVAVILAVWYLGRRKFAYRPVSLDDSDDENLKLMADHKPASLYFENVSYTLNGKVILDRIQGVARPGQIMAIMGASGAGKTTFLDILARKNKRGSVEGNFYVNGEKVGNSDYKNVIGFVDQEDTMLPTLTVHETIMTSAMLRLPRDMGHAAKELRVYEVEKQLGISHIKDSLIGSEEGNGRGISGGEKRRVGIACELVTSPSILFLDEPTSGLDAFNAFNVIECLVTLAKTYNRTVIFTIHQPRSNIVALFDQLVLLAKGKTVYSGEFALCQNYFDSIGYSCPPGFNIADYLVDLTMHVESPGTPSEEDDSQPNNDERSPGPSSTRAVKSIASVRESLDEGDSAGESLLRPNRHRRDSIKKKQERGLFTRKKTTETVPLTNVPSTVLEDHDLPPLSSGQNSALDLLVSSYVHSSIAGEIREDIQTTVANAQAANGQSNGLSGGNGTASPNGNTMGKGYARIGYWRQFTILSQRTWRNLYRNPMLMLTHYAIAILLAVLSGFLFYGLTDDIPGFQNRLGLFFFLLALFGFSTLTSLTVFASERLLFVRERANGYYAPITYFLAKVVFDIIPLRIIPPIIMGSIVYPMTGLWPDMAHFLPFLLILVLFNLAAAAICLFIGIVCKDHGVANLIGSLVMLFSLLFAGLLLNHDAIPKAALWLQSLSIFHYGFESLIVNEVAMLTLHDTKFGLNIEVPGATILSSFGFDNMALWPDVSKLGAFAAVFVVLAYVAMHVLLVEKR